MSAFLVGHQTINAAVNLVLMAQGPRSTSEINTMGQSLWMMNALALEQRYTSEDANDYLPMIETYQFTHVQGVDFASILKATKCFLYQCNEGDVPEMALFKKLTAITNRYAATEQTAAYDAAPWGLCG